MKYRILLLLTLYIPAMLMAGDSKSIYLTGIVSDASTRLPLPGATVFIPDLKRGTVTDNNGRYRLDDLPSGRWLVVFRYVGYATYSVAVKLTQATELDVALKPALLESQEVVITGSAFTTDARSSSTPVLSLGTDHLMRSTGSNLMAAIASTPGLSSISTGPGISKPVVRGLSYNRVVVIKNGIRQEGQQWGDEHGIEIDLHSVDRIEILKGPGSLLYGSDALGGVIHILEPLPAPAGETRGHALAGYSTNNQMGEASLLLEGNQKGWVWRSHGSMKNAASYRTPDERIYNSAFNESNANLMLGLNKRWGYSHLHLSRWQSEIGMIEGERDSSGRFLDHEGNPVSNEDLSSRKIFLPLQKVIHQKISTMNNFIIGQSQLRFHGGWQRNDRKEFEESGTDPELFFTLQTLTGDLKYYLSDEDGMDVVFGLSSMWQQNRNQGEEFLIPDYHSATIGAMTSAKKSFGKFLLNGGLRYDAHRIHGEEQIEETDTLFDAFRVSFNAVSGSAGLVYRPGDAWHVKFNAGRGFRVPNITELSANGVHEGTFRYEIGNTSLKPETSFQLDLGLEAEKKTWNAAIHLFVNWINNYIYYRNTAGEQIEIDGEIFPVYRFTQGNSLLQGFEIHSDIHLLADLHFENSLSYVYGVNRETDRPLPFIPAMRMNNRIAYEWKFQSSSLLQGLELSLGAETCFRQSRTDEFEEPTDAYLLLQAGIKGEFKNGIQLYVQGANLTNRKYADHLSRLRQVDVLNPGINVAFKLKVPFRVKTTG
jgi:iron complex outermembrane receptor protein